MNNLWYAATITITNIGLQCLCQKQIEILMDC